MNEKEFTIESWGEKFVVHVEEHTYKNVPFEQLCLILVESDGMPYTTVTRAIESYRPPTPRHALIKNSDENKGMLEYMEEEGIVERTGLRIATGYIMLDEVVVAKSKEA